MATAMATRLRFRSLVRPALMALPPIISRRASVKQAGYRLVVSERMVWHPSLGWRSTTVYQWLPVGMDGCV